VKVEWIIFKLYSSLRTDICKNRIDETILQNWKDRLFGLGYVGNIDIYDGYFWIYNRVSMYRSNNGGYEFYAARKFEGNILKNNDETMIVGEFKLLAKYKIWMSIWFLILSFVLFFCLYNFILSGDSFQKYITTIIVLLAMYIVGWGVMKFNIYKGKKAEEETIEFIKSLFEIYNVECEE
jgi:hypothetical protein